MDSARPKKHVWGKLTHAVTQRDATDETLFDSIAELDRLECLYLGSSKITDAGLPVLRDFPSLNLIDLAKTAVTDAGLATVASFPAVRMLVLNDCQVTDAGLDALHNLATLENIALSGTKVTAAGIERLRRRFPGVHVHYNSMRRA